MHQEFRLAASTVLLRSDEKGEVTVLLVEKPRKRDRWQLPQGGREGRETIVQCALRELREETGIKNVRVLGVSAHVYEYRFPATYLRFRPDGVIGQRIRFVHLVPVGDVNVQVDGEEIVGCEWVKPATLHRYIHREKYRATVNALVDEGRSLLGSPRAHPTPHARAVPQLRLPRPPARHRRSARAHRAKR